jgi:hypothetical protein
MRVTKKMDDYTVFLRACEGMPVLIVIIVCLAISGFMRKSPLF